MSKPLTPAIVHILLALADDDRHGYGIMQEVARLTDGDFGRAIAFAVGYFVLATAWNWWRFRQRLERGERP